MNHLNNAMGVLNVTPNSFSDGNLYTDYEHFKIRFKSLHNNTYIVDIGAESTAPMNHSIGHQEEWSRLEQTILRLIREGFSIPSRLSLDTYRSETINKFAAFLYDQMDWKGELWWNDVSGVWDDSVELFLNKYPHSNYVYSFTFVDHRDNAGNHQHYQTSDNSLFLKKLEHFGEKIPEQYRSRVILDPAFGFSKSRDQNYLLWKQLPDLMAKHSAKWLIGLSRKSFLRFPQEGQESDYVVFEAEILQALLIQKLNESDRNQKVFYRIHRPEILRAISNLKFFL